MTTQILETIQSEPPLHRWLHCRDPDRHLSSDILNSSATYITSLPPSQMKKSPTPPTVSLIVPMYRRKHFVLGQLYGPMSSNLMLFNLLSDMGYATPLKPISRRFVVDLSHDTISFIEYEWFADGKLCVTLHHIKSDGMYEGESMLLDDPKYLSGEKIRTNIERDDLLHETKRSSPTKLITRVHFKQIPTCKQCHPFRTNCLCLSSPTISQNTSQQKPLYQSPTNWDTWLNAFGLTRTGIANIDIKFDLYNINGPIKGQMSVLLDQAFELGIDENSPTGFMLGRKFLHAADMNYSHPNIDSICHPTNIRSNISNNSNQITQQENWNQFCEVLIEQPCSKQYENQNEDLISSIADDQSIYQTSFADEPFVDERASQISIPSPLHIDKHDIDQVTQTSNDINPNSTYISSPRQEELQSELQPIHNTTLEPQITPTMKVLQSTEEKMIDNENEKISLIRKIKATKKRPKQKKKLSIVCDLCGHIFDHRGHYNEHRKGKHEGHKPHECQFPGCQSRFSRKSDRDRHMRSKHE